MLTYKEIKDAVKSKEPKRISAALGAIKSSPRLLSKTDMYGFTLPHEFALYQQTAKIVGLLTIDHIKTVVPGTKWSVAHAIAKFDDLSLIDFAIQENKKILVMEDSHLERVCDVANKKSSKYIASLGITFPPKSIEKNIKAVNEDQLVEQEVRHKANDLKKISI